MGLFFILDYLCFIWYHRIKEVIILKKRIVIDIDKELWRQVSIQVAKECTTKYEFVEKALKEKLITTNKGG